MKRLVHNWSVRGVEGKPWINLLRLDLFTNLLDGVRTVSLVVMGSQEVVKPDESKRQVLGLGILQALKDNLHDLDEVRLQSGTRGWF